MSNLAFVAEIDGVQVTDVVATITLARVAGSIIIENQDDENALFVTLDGTTPVAVFGTAQVYRILAGKPLCLGAVQISVIKAICGSGLTADLQYAAWPDMGIGRGAN